MDQSYYFFPTISCAEVYWQSFSLNMLLGCLFDFVYSLSAFFSHKHGNHFLCLIFCSVCSLVFHCSTYVHLFMCHFFVILLPSLPPSTTTYHHDSFCLSSFLHTSSQAFKPTPKFFLKILLSCGFPVIFKPSYEFVFYHFLLSMCFTSSRCCSFQGIALTSFKYFLLVLPTNTKSISVSFPPVLYVIFLCCCFSNHVFATQLLFISKPKQFFLSTFLLPIPYALCTALKS